MTTSNDKLQLPIITKDLTDAELRFLILGMANNEVTSNNAINLAQTWYDWVTGGE